MLDKMNTANNRVRLAFIALVMIVVLAFGTFSPMLIQSANAAVPTDEVFSTVYEQVSPSVVSISVVARQSGTGVFGQDQEVSATGTGFVLDTAGHILTNNHVVDGATEIDVSFVDGTLANAEIVGLDPDSDLAVIQVDLPENDLNELQPVTFGDSNALQIGQTVLAIGSPFGQRWTLTSGIVSATGRSIQGLTDFSIGGVIQTDAAINPGNSGGPLLDLEGHVIGVNSQIISSTNSSAGIGFAIPGNLAQRVAQKLIENGFVDYSYVGISGRDVYLPLIKAFNLPNDTQGVVVASVSAGGPANRTGLKDPVFATEEDANNARGVPQSVDVITAINGEPLSGISELISYLAASTEPGQIVTLTILRLSNESSEELTLDVHLTPRP
ncbi:MAG: trypsin-like peptidase domain-containing protein [Anaerolineae bacterium]|nr:trypsin-like peptidase domain-containing protein [Anaerolineae bacterium]